MTSSGLWEWLIQTGLGIAAIAVLSIGYYVISRIQSGSTFFNLFSRTRPRRRQGKNKNRRRV